MKKYCSLNRNNELIAIGELWEVVHCTFNWSLEDGKLVVRVKGCIPVSYHSYSSEWSPEEMVRDINSFLVTKAPSFGITIFADVHSF